MVADETALVVALPDDDISALERKVVQSRARHVQILVPEGVTLLQDPAAAARLARAGRGAGIELLLISGDDATLRAARAGELLTMQVQGARVLAPPRPQPPASAAPVVDPPAGPRPTVPLEPEPRDVATGNLARDLSAGDAAFLEALDDLDTAPLRSHPAEADEDAAKTLISLYNADKRHLAKTENQTLADQLRRQSQAGADDDIAAALDSIEEEHAPPVRTPPLPAMPRVRPEDIELTDDDRRRMARPRPAPPAPRPARAQAPAQGQATPRPDRGVAYTLDTDAPADRPAPARRSRGSGGLRWVVPLVLLLALLALLALGALLWVNRNNGGQVTLPFGPNPVTITVSLPASSQVVEPVERLAIPVAAPGGVQTAPGEQVTAIEAAVLSSESTITVPGTVSEGVQTPSGTASGVVTVASLNTQPIPIPAGTEFIAVKADGQEVPFLSTAEVVVPPATTVSQGFDLITSRGQAGVPISARSPGSASNVDANSIRRMVLPGGQNINVVDGNLLVRHDPIGGGSESLAFVVREADVQRALIDALTQLDGQARQQLQEQAAAQGLTLAETTIFPRRETLEQLQGFELVVSPNVGETVDPANPTFSVAASARYSALATPPAKPLVGDNGQLGGVFSEQLRRAGLLQLGDCRAPNVTNWQWDGATLFVDGTVGPDPRCPVGLEPAVEQRVKQAALGKSRAEAAAALDALVAEGLIGGYNLPADAETLPDADWRIRVDVQR